MPGTFYTLSPNPLSNPTNEVVLFTLDKAKAKE